MWQRGWERSMAASCTTVMCMTALCRNMAGYEILVAIMRLSSPRCWHILSPAMKNMPVGTAGHDYAYGHFHDRQHGEWFGYLHRDGSIAQPAKGNLFKGPIICQGRMVLYANMDRYLAVGGMILPTLRNGNRIARQFEGKWIMTSTILARRWHLSMHRLNVVLPALQKASCHRATFLDVECLPAYVSLTDTHRRIFRR